MHRKVHNYKHVKFDTGLAQEFIKASGLADATAEDYARRTKRWSEWAKNRDYQVFPVKVDNLVEFFYSEVRRGNRPTTMKQYASALSQFHVFIGLEEFDTEKVYEEIRNLERKYGRPKRKSRGITLDVLRDIEKTVYLRRFRMRMVLETKEQAAERGLRDLALINCMRDGLLSPQEVKAACWKDITRCEDGSGTLKITDRRGIVYQAYLSPRTMDLLFKFRKDCDDTAPIFPETKRLQLQRYIKNATREAGCGDGFDLYSPRMGMAEDLLRSGEELPAVMIAGRWKTPDLLERYFEHILLERGKNQPNGR